MTWPWFLWALSTVAAFVYGALWVRTLRALTDAEIERDEAIDRWLFAAPTSFSEVRFGSPPLASCCFYVGTPACPHRDEWPRKKVARRRRPSWADE